MRVESLIRRPLGHTVHLDGGASVYAFVPEHDYQCEVANPRHLETFRAIAEGYRVIGSGPVVESENPIPDALSAKRRARRFVPAGQATLMPADERE